MSTPKKKKAQEKADSVALLLGDPKHSREQRRDYLQMLATSGNSKALDEILEGALEHVVEPLINEYQADQLAALSN